MTNDSNAIGCFNKLEFSESMGFFASGWAINISAASKKLSIDLVLDDEVIATGLARHFRRDLHDRKIGDGFNAFSILIPTAKLVSAKQKTIYAYSGGHEVGRHSVIIDRSIDVSKTIFNPGNSDIESHDLSHFAAEDIPTDYVCGLSILRNGGVFDPEWYLTAYPDVAQWCRDTAVSPLFHYLRMGKAERRNPHIPFNDDWYRARYGKLIAQMGGAHASTPFEHYAVVGSVFGFDALPGFDEQSYLETNSDVRQPVADRLLLSGYRHYVMYGLSEGRPLPPGLELPRLTPSQIVGNADFATLVAGDPNAPDQNGRNWAAVNAGRCPVRPLSGNFAGALYEGARPDVKGAVESGALPSSGEHWRMYGFREDMAGLTARLPGFREGRYLAENPDVSAAVSSGLIASGYDHFLTDGHAEKRPGGIVPDVPAPQTVSPTSILRRIAERESWPLVSIIMPVYEAPERWLRSAIDSVLEQLYPFWELCIVNDASPSPYIYEVLEEYAARDPRIRTVHLPANGGISAASNTALDVAKGEWIALLDHDDQLTPDALYEVASTVIGTGADAVYSDEAKMAVDGRIYDYTYKPDWSPDFLLSTMYIGHLTCYRKAIVQQAGGFRSEYDGTQDYDLALRVAALTDRFVHIPKVLYHWVAIPGSTAETLSAKNYAVERQKKALESAVARHAVTAFEVQPHWMPGNWRVAYAPPTPAPLVSIVIPSAGRIVDLMGFKVDLLKNCITSLFSSECYENIEIVVIHNGDLQPSTEQFLLACGKVKMVRYSAENFNFSEKINLGVRHASGEYVLLLNDDIQAISKNFLADMVGRACQPGVGIVGPRLLFANSAIQHVGVVLIDGSPSHALIGEHRKHAGPQGIGQLVHNAIGVTGACMLLSRALYLEIGGFDEELPLNYNDVDLCNKVAQKGLRIVVDPGVELYHFESLSKEGTFNWELQKFIRRWGVKRDPYVNVNFRQDNPFYEVRRDLPARALQDVQQQIMLRMATARSKPPVDQSIRFSFFMSTYHQPIKFLQELEKTVLNQFYRNFEWVIVSDGDHRPELLKWLDGVGRHENVKVIVSPENLGIMGAYGLAFQATSGDYVLPIDADDFLTLDALEVMAEHIRAHGFPAVLYSDEFKSNPQSRLFSPFHKPDFDWVLHTNVCYTCHLCALRRDVGVELGAYTDGTATWCHDWDTFTRFERAGHTPVHVPHLLYAWRINPGSTASIESSGKSGTRISQEHVLKQHLALTGLDRRLELAENTLFPHPGVWRLRPKDGQTYQTAMVIAADSADAAAVDAILALLTLRTSSVASIRIAVPSVEVMNVLNDGLHAAGVGTGDMTIVPHPVAAVLAQASGDADYVFFAQTYATPRDPACLFELTGLLHGVDEAVAIGGRVLDTRDKVAWAGGFFGLGGFLATADYGRDAEDSGYHGMGFCQRFVDGVSPSHWLARAGFLSSLLETLPQDVTAPQIASAIALWAHAKDRRVLYTPFSPWKLSCRAHIQPPMPSASLLQTLDAAVPTASRYYSPRLHTSMDLLYQPAGYA